jgi:hypothetical protein
MFSDVEFKELPKRETAWRVRDRITVYRKQLLAAGYRPLPCNGKVPLPAGWQDILATDAIVDKWADRHPDAEQLTILVEEMLGKSPVRIGKAPKRAMVFRTDTPFDKLSTPVFTSPDGGIQKVEVLCRGQQIILSGIHPDTQQPYAWHGGEPGPALKHGALPLLTAEKAAGFIAAAAELMANRGWIPAEKKTNGAGGVHHAGAPTIRERAYARAAMEGCADELARAPSGERNSTLNKRRSASAP